VSAVHSGVPYLPRRDPREAARSLRYALHREGVTHTFQSNGNGMSVLSLSAELTVWCQDGCFAWKEDGVVVTHPADDPSGAAGLIHAHFRRPVGLDDSDDPGEAGDTYESGHQPPTSPPSERSA
jgi:hypothetical protein